MANKDKHIEYVDIDSFFIEWLGPEGDWPVQYLCVSETSGLYWNEDIMDPNIVDGSLLPFKFDPEDTIKQIAEKWKLKKGIQFERRNLFKHPTEHAWLVVEKLPSGERDPDTNKLIRTYQAYWSRKFKAVSCISRLTGRPQGNPSLQDKEYAKKASANAKAARKKRMENVERAAKRLNFNPAEQLIAWAQGDENKLNTKQPITNAQRLKALEIYASYSYAKPKPIDPLAMEKQKERQSLPVVHVTLPSNSRELGDKVVTHQSQDELDKYFQSHYTEPDELEAVDREAGEYDEENGVFLPDNGRKDE
ncbi:MAG: hypothetical protein CMF22_10145 [Idiomarinaceae bacterium]|nr:hypothetical protein [Idiomarinaceae bacterium]MBG23802.1 hypothetical protein [Idiomarinaceae bacterium]|tara:strand:+ start:42798 stop:43715 length:918 start_codon:yes stop_codon:yes gene_type:complete